MKNQKRYLYLNDEEHSIVLHSLVKFRNALIKQGRYTDCVDELIVKAMGAPTKKIKIV